MPSVLNVDTIADAAGTGPVALTKQEALKCQFRTSGTYTGFQAGALNASSLTDDGTGDITVSFTNSFSTSTYSVATSSVSSAGRIITFNTIATANCSFAANTDAGAAIDAAMSVHVAGDLA